MAFGRDITARKVSVLHGSFFDSLNPCAVVANGSYSVSLISCLHARHLRASDVETRPHLLAHVSGGPDPCPDPYPDLAVGLHDLGHLLACLSFLFLSDHHNLVIRPALDVSWIPDPYLLPCHVDSPQACALFVIFDVGLRYRLFLIYVIDGVCAWIFDPSCPLVAWPLRFPSFSLRSGTPS